MTGSSKCDAQKHVLGHSTVGCDRLGDRGTGTGRHRALDTGRGKVGVIDYLGFDELYG
jgi:hypothetical protein